MSPVKPVPDGFHTLNPHMIVRDANGAIEFYKKAFGAEEIMRMPGPDGKTIMHAELKFGDSTLMLCEEAPQMQRCVSPQSLNGTTVVLALYVEDADALFDRAVAAGASVTMPMMDAFWGDRFGKVGDPFGHEWEIVTHKKDLSPDEIQKGAEEFFKSFSCET